MPIDRPAHNPLPSGLLGPELPLDEMLYEADTPVLFVTHTSQGQPLLAYVADDSGHDMVTLLCPLSPAVLDALKRGALGVREALSASWLWMHVSDGERSDVWATDINTFPSSHLPVPGTPLLAEHEPVFRARAVGKQVVLGRMPASVVAFVADATRRAFKTILDFRFDARSEGRPTEEHRALYDLPIQQFAFASFELSFGAPDEGFFLSEAVREAADLLMDGLRWASDTNSREPMPGESTDQRAAVLRAALLLTPPLSGAIEEMQVSGLWVPGERIRLTRDSRRKIKGELRTVTKDHVVAYNGRIRELDMDNLSFILRETDDNHDKRGVISEDQLEDVSAYFIDEVRVTIAGVERGGRLYVAAVAPYAAPAAPADVSQVEGYKGT